MHPQTETKKVENNIFITSKQHMKLKDINEIIYSTHIIPILK